MCYFKRSRIGTSGGKISQPLKSPVSMPRHRNSLNEFIIPNFNLCCKFICPSSSYRGGTMATKSFMAAFYILDASTMFQLDLFISQFTRLFLCHVNSVPSTFQTVDIS